jgi:hypothetical protein
MVLVRIPEPFDHSDWLFEGTIDEQSAPKHEE